MGWVDNIDAELQADNQPGCSGLGRTRPTGNSIDGSDRENSDPKDDQPDRSGLNNASPAIDDSDMGDEEPKEKEDPIVTFAEKVTIAGLEEAFKSEYKNVRIMFRLGLIAAFAMIVYQANLMSDQYHDMTNTIDTEINEEPPFPNISVCFPPFMNGTAILEKINDLVVPDRLRSMMKTHNTNFSDLLEFLQGAVGFKFTADDIHKPITLMTRMLYDALRGQAIEDLQPTFDILEYSCSGRIENCYLNQQPIDCCQFSQHLDMWQKRCLIIQIDKMKNALNLKGSRMLEFTFHAMIDWKFGDDILSDGFDMFIGQQASQTLVPITVPSGMDAVITLAQPKLVHQFDDCLPNENVPKLKHFQYFDQDGINCLFDSVNEIVVEHLGCKMPVQSYIPSVNETCLFSKLSIMMLIATGDSTGKGFMNQKGSDEAFKYMAELASGRHSNCKPLCTRWISRVHSTSFNLIEYSHESQTQVQMENKSWSLIRIVMPDTMYMDRQEMQIKAWYLAMCDIGGMMGVYAGFSAVTFVQIFAYGLYVIWWKWKNHHNHGAEVARLENPACPKGRTKPKLVESHKSVEKVDTCETAC